MSIKTILFSFSIISILILTGCSASRKTTRPAETNSSDIHSTVVIKNKVPARKINTKNVAATDVVNFAETLIGVKYKYGSSIKEKGFDCSGFINYVFNHFNIRPSIFRILKRNFYETILFIQMNSRSEHRIGI